ncbi:MAG: lysyl oxidase family protein [Bacteroidota bacterium]
MKHQITLLAFLACTLQIFAQNNCVLNQNEVIISVLTDNYPNESSWELVDAYSGTVYLEVPQGGLANGTVYSDTICTNLVSCLVFTIYDSFGDGICCGFGQGSWEVMMNGELVATGGEFAHSQSISFNCVEGFSCTSAEVVSEGINQSSFDDHWYEFTPDTTGIFTISTCGTNTCDTEIWIYDDCGNALIDETNAGTIYYDDNEGGCSEQAVVTATLEPGITYFIRIGDADDDCPGAINWELTYVGPVIGCMDPTACNYQPLATVDDGSCIFPGDPDCPDGPDLLMREDVLAASIYLASLNNGDACAVSEGCLQGYGNRDIIRFTTHIQNIGNVDYYIGPPTAESDQFTFDNCHGHWHYDGYAEYILYDDNGLALPIGFKNGFCVIDLECSGGGSPSYGCGNMGISAGCGDIYSSGLSCQWIDVTDVPDGRYTFVTRTNWDFAPDVLGRYETNHTNNWAQVCILLDRSSGTLQFSLDDQCDPFIDCSGEIYGSAQPDCTGECQGLTLMGDLDENGSQEMVDAQGYVTLLLGDDISPTSCNDLNADNAITVYDAALMSSCLNYGGAHWHPDGGAHNHCNFPENIENINDTVTLSIINANFEEQYIDIGIYNPDNHVVAYQFEMGGIMIENVENLIDPVQYPITPQSVPGDYRVIGISYDDSLIMKSNIVKPLCRINYLSNSSDTICLEAIIDIVNDNYETVITKIENGCVDIPVSTDIENIENDWNVGVDPNPFSESTRLHWDNPNHQSFNIDILSMDGKVIARYRNIQANEIEINGKGLSKGMYLFRLQNDDEVYTGKMIIQ